MIRLTKKQILMENFIEQFSFFERNKIFGKMVGVYADKEIICIYSNFE